MNSNQAALQILLQKYQISSAMANRLKTLQNFKVCLILDDSTSMNIVDSQAKGTSRWYELSNFAKIVIEIASMFTLEGVDVHFLNMQPVKKVRSFDELSLYFRDKPSGATPLSRTIQNVIQENPVESLNNRNLLILIATDGEPTDATGYSNIPEFKQTLKNRPNYVYTNIAACTDDDISIGYLNGLDRELARLDVIDDYAMELAEIKRKNGPEFQFSFGDYVTKAILGSISPDLDISDEIPQSSSISSVLQKYQITDAMARRLEVLRTYKITLILDDSSTMNKFESNIRRTRWQELIEAANAMIEIVSVFNPNGCDVNFLNMMPLKNVRDINQLSIFFRDPPAGPTSLSRVLRAVVRENISSSLLIIMITDGEPTDDQGLNDNFPDFINSLSSRPNNVFTNILLCTQNSYSTERVNGLARELPRLDVVSDFDTEAAEIRKAQGPNFLFTIGDHFMKALLGSINPVLNKLDDARLIPQQF